jgi:hypothetical protein
VVCVLFYCLREKEEVLFFLCFVLVFFGIAPKKSRQLPRGQLLFF